MHSEVKNFKRRLSRQVEKEQRKRARFTEVQEIRRVVLVNYSNFEESYSDQEYNGTNSKNNTSETTRSPIQHDLQLENYESDNRAFDNEDVSNDENQNDLVDNNELFIQGHDIEEFDNEEIEESEGNPFSSSSEESSDSDTDSSSSSDFDDRILLVNEEEREQYAADTLRGRACSGGTLSMKKLGDLLLRLHPLFSRLPLSYKTLLRTPKRVDIQDLGEGSQRWYNGIENSLQNMSLQDYLDMHGEIIIDVGIDGLPISKSSRLKFWPIMGRLVHAEKCTFVIAVFFGTSDRDPDIFLPGFVNEVLRLKRLGFWYNNTFYLFSIRHFILNAPARSLVKCTINHGAYGACEKCSFWKKCL